MSHSRGPRLWGRKRRHPRHGRQRAGDAGGVEVAAAWEGWPRLIWRQRAARAQSRCRVHVGAYQYRT